MNPWMMEACAGVAYGVVTGLSKILNSDGTQEAPQAMENRIKEEQRKYFEEEKEKARREHAEALRSALDEQREELDEELNSKLEQISQQAKEAQDQLERSLQESREEVALLKDALQKPVQDREAKVNYVNSLELKIQTTDSILLLGGQGTYKSTFLWLMGAGIKPVKTMDDGTVDIVIKEGFIDTIGLRGWTTEQLIKVVVLLIYHGFPKDLIIFLRNDRIIAPITQLGLLGIHTPMLVIIKDSFWAWFEEGNAEQQQQAGEGEHKSTTSNEASIYDFTTYKSVENSKVGAVPVTHISVTKVSADRVQQGIHPFQHLHDGLGKQFTMKSDQQGSKTAVAYLEAIFRLIYVYEKKYEKNDYTFMKEGNLMDFESLNNL